MKYKTEQEFCEHVTKLILGILVGEKRQVICIPEVPRNYWSNEHVDMMLLDIKNKELLCIEYKLNNPEKLNEQVRNTISRGLPCIGIINTKHRREPDIYDCMIQHLFGYTGEDYQLEKIAEEINYKHTSTWGSIYDCGRMMYYWAYKNNKSRFDGGTFGVKRQMFASIYMQAIRNLHVEYGKLDFMLTHAVLGSGYSISVSRKYYRSAIKNPPAEAQGAGWE